ncbi:hypothetical protein NQZ68_016401 [Dissostichus eleginoides]|nr:hypothetical protein NQZ68_016401 [Dissostichus eleginoides]
MLKHTHHQHYWRAVPSDKETTTMTLFSNLAEKLGGSKASPHPPEAELRLRLLFGGSGIQLCEERDGELLSPRPWGTPVDPHHFMAQAQDCTLPQQQQEPDFLLFLPNNCQKKQNRQVRAECGARVGMVITHVSQGQEHQGDLQSHRCTTPRSREVGLRVAACQRILMTSPLPVLLVPHNDQDLQNSSTELESGGVHVSRSGGSAALFCAPVPLDITVLRRYDNRVVVVVEGETGPRTGSRSRTGRSTVALYSPLSENMSEFFLLAFLALFSGLFPCAEPSAVSGEERGTLWAVGSQNRISVADCRRVAALSYGAAGENIPRAKNACPTPYLFCPSNIENADLAAMAAHY